MCELIFMICSPDIHEYRAVLPICLKHDDECCYKLFTSDDDDITHVEHALTGGQVDGKSLK